MVCFLLVRLLRSSFPSISVDVPIDEYPQVWEDERLLEMSLEMNVEIRLEMRVQFARVVYPNLNRRRSPPRDEEEDLAIQAQGDVPMYRDEEERLVCKLAWGSGCQGQVPEFRGLPNRSQQVQHQSIRVLRLVRHSCEVREQGEVCRHKGLGRTRLVRGIHFR